MASTYVGVDGGATRTRALLTDEEARELGSAEGPGSLVDETNVASSARVISDVVREALARAGEAPPAYALTVGVAGGGSAPVRSRLRDVLLDLGVASEVHVVSDVEVAAYDAFGDGAGILLVAGTGSIAWGRGPGGRRERVGGWGSRVGDEGSAFDIGRSALRAAARGRDGRAEVTPLTDELLAARSFGEVGELMRWAEAASKAEVAALAPLVVEAADRGNPVAREILGEAVAELILLVETLVRRLQPWEAGPIVALVGALVEPQGPLRLDVERELAARDLQVAEGIVRPERGAATLARSWAGEAPDGP